MSLTTKLDELDKVFDILLLLLSIITAVLFQYGSTIEPLRIVASKPNLTQQQLLQEVDRNLSLYLRILFIPLFVLIALWLVNRLSSRTRTVRARSLPEFCYTFAAATLAFNIYFFAEFSFPSVMSLGSPGLLLFIFVLQPLISFPLIYFHEISFVNQTNVRTRMQKLWKVWMPIMSKDYMLSVIAWFVLAVVLAICFIPLMGS